MIPSRRSSKQRFKLRPGVKLPPLRPEIRLEGPFALQSPCSTPRSAKPSGRLARRARRRQNPGPAASRSVRGSIEKRVDHRGNQCRPRAIPGHVRELLGPTTPGHRPKNPAAITGQYYSTVHPRKTGPVAAGSWQERPPAAGRQEVA